MTTDTKLRDNSHTLDTKLRDNSHTLDTKLRDNSHTLDTMFGKISTTYDNKKEKKIDVAVYFEMPAKILGYAIDSFVESVFGSFIKNILYTPREFHANAAYNDNYTQDTTETRAGMEDGNTFIAQIRNVGRAGFGWNPLCAGLAFGKREIRVQIVRDTESLHR